MQRVKVVAATKEVKEQDNISNLIEELKILGGKAAGVCYMPDDYLSEGIQDETKASKRADGNVKNGHHSVFDHGHITFVIETNKMMAMLLNSLGVYTTSEKSARYTVMKPKTDLELTLYNKWTNKIQKLILEVYPDMDDEVLSTRLCKKMGIEKSKAVINGSCSHIKDDEFLENELKELKKSDTLPSRKLAMENARYMISVFTPTTMEYTVSFRQIYLINEYLNRLIDDCIYIEKDIDKIYEKDEIDKVLEFVLQLHQSASELSDEIKSIINQYDFNIENIKNQHFRFLEAQHYIKNVIINKDSRRLEFFTQEEMRLKGNAKKKVIGDSYTTTYVGSLAMLAQAQRHRTLRYTMYIDYAGQFGWYVPAIIEFEGKELVNEWLNDMKSVSYCIPQGTLVRITEQGIFEDFALKCKERMCGRAQLEVMQSTTNLVKLFINNKDSLSYSNQKLLESMTIDFDERGCKGLTPYARCMYKDFNCREGCQWGPKGALTRLV